MKHILVTGLPGVGKTTVCLRLFEALRGNCDVNGFVTEEVRHGREREGFDIVLLPSCQRIPLARIGKEGVRGPHVGKYVVDVASVEHCVVPFLREIAPSQKKQMFLIDEIGKMEMMCPAFEAEIRRLFEQRDVLVVSTVALRGSGFIEEVKSDKANEVCEVKKGTRDDDCKAVLAAVMAALKEPRKRPR